jgi:lipoate-protein ligase A
MNWSYHNSGLCPAAYNMAFDEALLEAMPRLRAPVLRFYGWTEPAATFGYFQRYAEVAATTHLRPLIRRPTGGGIVPHDIDWTYSAAFPPGHEWHGLKAEESYRRIHDWLRLAFAELDIPTELAPSAKKSLPGQCFVGHEKSDLLWHGRKIAGAAQRRNQLGLLIQGSIQPPAVKLEREKFHAAMLQVAEKILGVKWQELKPDAELSQHVEKLAAEKFSQDSYNQKR